ncbi:hypothetical protein C9I57_18815 [Trinickia symbiotica]|uniref:Uncharacterized protein n=1 Tax=Trinickia symbiotica TaxID=863227 RepID=A0A2T3XRG5_9BURK|nr:hypothetical protein C9I57_18815 [Trinickia symbiotica]
MLALIACCDTADITGSSASRRFYVIAASARRFPAMDSTRLAESCVTPDHARASEDIGDAIGIWAVFEDWRGCIGWLPD